MKPLDIGITWFQPVVVLSVFPVLRLLYIPLYMAPAEIKQLLQSNDIKTKL